MLQGDIISAKCEVPVVLPGTVTDPVAETGHDVSEPVGTSENWYVNCTLEVGERVTVVGGPFAAVETSTLRPSVMVVGITVPPEVKRASVG